MKHNHKTVQVKQVTVDSLMNLLEWCSRLTPATREHNPGIGAGALNTIINQSGQLLNDLREQTADPL